MFSIWQRCKGSAALISTTLFAGFICQPVLSNPAKAQIIPDATLGAESSEFDANRNRIRGGAVRGNEALFHSFQEFNVPDGEQIRFVVGNDITRIFTRVTGDNVSNILGTIRIRSRGDADLFLINPNGIFMGPNAQLDIEGSFLASTADGIQFENFVFGTSDDNTAIPDTLLVVQPSALIFTALTPAPINSRANQLRVEAEEQIQLVGGDINLFPDADNDIDLQARGGAVEIGSLAAPGIVGLLDERLQFPDNVDRADVRLDNLKINVANAGDGDIAIYGDDITLRGSNLEAGYRDNRGRVDRPVGDVVVDATGNIDLTGSTIRSNLANGTTGARGNVTLRADGNISLNQSAIQTEVKGVEIELLGISDSGSINIIAGGNLTVDTSRISSIINRDGRSERSGEAGAGSITIRAAALDMRTADGTPDTRQASISTSNNSIGNGGTIRITVDRLTMVGPGRDGSSGISSNSSMRRAVGDAGSVIITVNGPMIMTRRGKIETVVQRRANGRSGNVIIRADSLMLSDDSSISARNIATGEAGNVFVNLDGDLTIVDNSSISAQTRGTRAADADPNELSGNITIVADDILLTDQGDIEVSTGGENNAGRIAITADTIEISDTFIAGETRVQSSGLFSRSLINANGTGGDIVLRTGLLWVRGNAAINASSESTARGGNLEIIADRIELLDGGQLVASTFAEGDAGSVRVLVSDQLLIAGEDPAFAEQVVIGRQRLEEGRISALRQVVNRQGANGLATDDPNNSAPSGIFTISEESGAAGSIIIRDASSQLSNNSTQAETTIRAVAQDAADERLDVVIRDGGTISAQALRQGNAGSIIIDISGALEMVNGNIRTDAAELDGGNINVDAQTLQITDGSSINARGSGRGDAGDIIIAILDELEISDSDIRTDAVESAGGSISIDAATILMRGDGDIRTNVASGAGSGGNIFIVSDILIALDDSDILAFAQEGAGGNITLPTFFGQNFVLLPSVSNPNDLDLNDRVDVNASGQLSSGVISFPDVSFIENSLTELPDALINTESLVATSCIAQTAQSSSSLVVTGADGIPLQSADGGIFIQTGAVRSLSESSPEVPTVSRIETPTERPAESENWTTGDAISEPHALYQLSDGRLVLSKDC